jgi:hypothetical protein
MRLIGLHARSHAGKDTAFEIIRQINPKADRKAFADPVKLSGMATLGMVVERDGTREQILNAANYIKNSGRILVTYDDPRFPAKGFQTVTLTGRQFWQFLGTEGHREPSLGHSFGENFWVDNLLPIGRSDNWENLTKPGPEFPAWWLSFEPGTEVAVITDVRFANEAERIRFLGGEVWRIDADERLGPNTDTHDSEQRLPDEFITRTIDNNGSVEMFELEVKRAYNA